VNAPFLPTACGCEDLSEGRLVPVDVALGRALALAEPVAETDILPLGRATGRILAGPATSPVPLPPFDNAAMDGYALRLADLEGEGPWRLPVTGRIAAGDAPRAMPAEGALRILTGAPVPPECDAVVMQEHVRRLPGAILVDRPPEPGTNIRRRGEDLASGAAILPAGRVVGAREAAALAATGNGSVAVRRRVRVALFCTGSELRAPGKPLAPGQIWNANRFLLRAALDRPWIDLDDLGTVPDRREALSETLRQAAATADVVVSTGGVSVGDEDHMPRLFRQAGGDIHALRIAMKPGKPLALGRMGEAIYIGLPGNPVSAFVAWHILGARVAEKRAGMADPHLPRILARAAFDSTRRPGRCEFRPARIVSREVSGTPRIELLSPSFSARVALLAAADGLAVIPADADRVARGDLLELAPL
jgi:molybdopterin molybdotransferase